MREKVTVLARFRKNAGWINPWSKPICRHQAEGFDVDSAKLIATGSVLRDGSPLEFHDVRIYFKERP